jgi:ribosome-associated protein
VLDDGVMRGEAEDVPVDGDMIRLGQFLKLAGVVDSGGEIKDLLATGDVLVNGEVDERRGRQLHPGDIVTVGTARLRVAGSPR